MDGLTIFTEFETHLDYDDVTLDFVRLDVARLLWMCPLLEVGEIWLSSYGKRGLNSFHVKFKPLVSRETMLLLVSHSWCSFDYRTYVQVFRECTLRTTKASRSQPVPFLLEEVRRDVYALQSMQAGRRTARRRLPKKEVVQR